MGIYIPTSDLLSWSRFYGLGPAVVSGLQSRDSFVKGAYNPCDYAGPTSATMGLLPWDQEWSHTNRVGIYGAHTLDGIDEGSGTSQIRVYSTPGQIIQNMVVYCTADIKAAGLIFINCLLLGPPTIEKQLVVATNSAANPSTFIDCTYVAQNPNRWASASIHSVGAGVYIRCDFYGISDAITPGGRWTGGIKVIQCAFHDMIMYGPDPGAAGGIDDAITHVDQTQMVGGSLIIQGSGYEAFYVDDPQYMQGAQPPINFGGTAINPVFHQFGNRYHPELHATSAVMMSPATYPIDEFEVSDSFLNGAVFPINCAGMTSANRFDFLRNKVKASRRSIASGDPGPTSYKTIVARTALQPSINVAGNVRFEDGTALSKSDLIQTGG